MVVEKPAWEFFIPTHPHMDLSKITFPLAALAAGNHEVYAY
jgi:hypothetical protein